MKSPVIVAVDFDSEDQVLSFARAVDPTNCRLKIGKGLFTRYGPNLVESVMKLGFEVFLDLKFHDIPNTVAHACRSASALGVWMLNVHCMGGVAMMEAAREAVQNNKNSPLLIGVTVLTSLSNEDLHQIFDISMNTGNMVTRLAGLAQQSGLNGVVCSGWEAAKLRAQVGEDFVLVTPGIRLVEGDENNSNLDQKRVMTPNKALSEGANYLVIGRPIYQSPNPQKTLESILHQLR